MQAVVAAIVTAVIVRCRADEFPQKCDKAKEMAF